MSLNGAVADILADLSSAQRALRDSSIAFDEAVANTGRLLAAIRDANHAQGAAIEAVIAATDKALALFRGREQ